MGTDVSFSINRTGAYILLKENRAPAAVTRGPDIDMSTKLTQY